MRPLPTNESNPYPRPTYIRAPNATRGIFHQLSLCSSRNAITRPSFEARAPPAQLSSPAEDGWCRKSRVLDCTSSCTRLCDIEAAFYNTPAYIFTPRDSILPGGPSTPTPRRPSGAVCTCIRSDKPLSQPSWGRANYLCRCTAPYMPTKIWP